MVVRSYKDFLQDILDAMNKAQSFVSSMDYETFKNDDKTAYAVIRALEVIGEATKHVPDNLRQKYPGVPWQDRVSPGKIWQIKPLIEKVLKETCNEKS